MEHIRTKFLNAAYGRLLSGGVLHFTVDVIAQYLRRKRAPGPETTAAAGWFAVCVLILDYTQPRSAVVIFAVLLGVGAFTS